MTGEDRAAFCSWCHEIVLVDGADFCAHGHDTTIRRNQPPNPVMDERDPATTEAQGATPDHPPLRGAGLASADEVGGSGGLPSAFLPAAHVTLPTLVSPVSAQAEPAGADAALHSRGASSTTLQAPGRRSRPDPALAPFPTTANCTEAATSLTAGATLVRTREPAPSLPVQNMDGSWVLARQHGPAPSVRRAPKALLGAPAFPEAVQASLAAWPPVPAAPTRSGEFAAVGRKREATLPVDGADRIRRLFAQAEQEETDADFARFAAFAPEVHRTFRDGGAMKLRPVVMTLAVLATIGLGAGLVRWYQAFPGREAAAQLIEVREAVIEARQAQTSLGTVIGTLTDPHSSGDEISTAGMGVASVVDNVTELEDVVAVPLPAALPFTDTTLVEDLALEQDSARTYGTVLSSLVDRVVTLYGYRLDSADILELELPTATGALDDAALIDLQVAVESELAHAATGRRELAVPAGYEAHAATVDAFLAGARTWWDAVEVRLLAGETVDWPAEQQTLASLRTAPAEVLAELLASDRETLLEQLDSIESTGQQLVNTMGEADVSLDV